MKKIKLSLVTSALLLGQLIMGVTIGTAFLNYFYQDKIIPGITINDINVGGMYPEDALTKVKTKIPQPTPNSVLILKDDDGNDWEIKYGEIDLFYDYHGAVNKAFNIGKSISPFTQIADFYKFVQGKVDLSLKVKFDKNALRQILTKNKSKYDIQPQNAQIAYSEGKVVLLTETVGRKINVEATIKQFDQLDITKHQAQLVVNKITPQLTSQNLKDINGQLSIYVTSFDKRKKPRVHNIKLASDRMNNTLIKPGEIFSLNHVLGSRTPEEGYKKAGVIVNNKLVNDFGGGVCQVATTLYNAVRIADLPIIERHRHTIPVDYVPRGQDATIAGDIKDFKFKNDGRKPLLISSKIEENKLIVSLLGNKDDAKNIQYKTETVRKVIKPKTIYKTDPNLQPGEIKIAKPGREGYDIITYEVTVINDTVVERKRISEHHVKPEDAVIILPVQNGNKNGLQK